MRFGAFVATFRRPSILGKTIELILEQTHPPEIILVVDNASCKDTESVARNFPQDRVVYEAMPDNLGSAGGTAFGIRWLYDKGYDAIFCGDDDDPPRTPDTMERLIGILTSSDSDVAGAGAVGAWWDWKRGRLRRLPD